MQNSIPNLQGSQLRNLTVSKLLPPIRHGTDMDQGLGGCPKFAAVMRATGLGTMGRQACELGWLRMHPLFQVQVVHTIIFRPLESDMLAIVQLTFNLSQAK